MKAIKSKYICLFYKFSLVTGVAEHLTSRHGHVSTPRVIPGQDNIIFFRNSLTVEYNETRVPNSINAPQSLVMLSLDYPANSETVVVDEHDHFEEFGHIYPDRVKPWPHAMFLQVINLPLGQYRPQKHPSNFLTLCKFFLT